MKRSETTLHAIGRSASVAPLLPRSALAGQWQAREPDIFLKTEGNEENVRRSGGGRGLVPCSFSCAEQSPAALAWRVGGLRWSSFFSCLQVKNERRRTASPRQGSIFPGLKWGFDAPTLRFTCSQE